MEMNAESSTVNEPKAESLRFLGVLSVAELVALAILAIGALVLFSFLIQVMSAGPVILTPGSTVVATPTAT